MSSTAALGSALFPPARLARRAGTGSGSPSFARPVTILPRSSRRRAAGFRVVAEAKDAKAKDAKGKDANAKETTAASSADKSAEKRAPPAPPAAPAGFEAELSRLAKAGARVHKLGTRYLDDGKTGEDVKELQRFLTGTGHYQYKDGPTGYYGPLTTQAVKRWQAKYGLPESGGWGAQSRATYLNVKRAELRAMRDPDPETAAKRNSAAMRAGLIDKNTGLPVPPSVGGGRAGAPGPSWVASAPTNSGAAGVAVAAKSVLPNLSFVQTAVLVVFAAAAVRSAKSKTSARGLGRLELEAESRVENDDAAAAEAEAEAATGLERSRAAVAADRGEIVDVEVWHAEDGDERKTRGAGGAGA